MYKLRGMEWENGKWQDEEKKNGKEGEVKDREEKRNKMKSKNKGKYT